MVEPLNLVVSAVHSRRSTATALSVIGAITSVVLAIALVAALVLGPADIEALDCSIEAPSDACLARLPEHLRGLPAAAVGVWFYAENANTKRSPPRYLKAEASWARLLPADASSADLAKRYDGRVPSPSAVEGELRMREAVLPEFWEPKSSDGGLRVLALPLGFGLLATLALSVVTGLRSRKWAPLVVKVTPEHVSIGAEQQRIESLMSIEVAPLRLVSAGGDLVLPPDYELEQGDHERLVEVLEAAMAHSRDTFLDDD